MSVEVYNNHDLARELYYRIFHATDRRHDFHEPNLTEVANTVAWQMANQNTKYINLDLGPLFRRTGIVPAYSAAEEEVGRGQYGLAMDHALGNKLLNPHSPLNHMGILKHCTNFETAVGVRDEGGVSNVFFVAAIR